MVGNFRPQHLFPGTNSVLHEYDPMHWNMFMLVSCQTPGFGVLRFANFNDTAKELWNSVKEPIEKISDKKYRKVCLVGTFNGRILMMHERSPCGYWVYGILEKNQRVFEDYRRLVGGFFLICVIITLFFSSELQLLWSRLVMQEMHGSL